MITTPMSWSVRTMLASGNDCRAFSTARIVRSTGAVTSLDATVKVRGELWSFGFLDWTSLDIGQGHHRSQNASQYFAIIPHPKGAASPKGLTHGPPSSLGRQAAARRAVAAALVVPPIEFGNVRAAA